MDYRLLMDYCNHNLDVLNMAAVKGEIPHEDYEAFIVGLNAHLPPIYHVKARVKNRQPNTNREPIEKGE